MNRMAKAKTSITVPTDVFEAAKEEGAKRNLSFSAIVAEALAEWVRGQLMDQYLRDYCGPPGDPLREEDLMQVAIERGLPYIAPYRTGIHA
jgi:hypothetical protein